jgi:hypothetical protein
MFKQTFQFVWGSKGRLWVPALPRSFLGGTPPRRAEIRDSLVRPALDCR